MRTVNALLDEAVKVCGGPARLAERLEVPRQLVHELVHHKRTITPCHVAALCDVLAIRGETARQLACLAAIEQQTAEHHRKVMQKVFELRKQTKE